MTQDFDSFVHHRDDQLILTVLGFEIQTWRRTYPALPLPLLIPNPASFVTTRLVRLAGFWQAVPKVWFQVARTLRRSDG